MVDSMEAVARRQHGLITRRQAYDAGLTPAAIRHLTACGRWSRVTYGVYRLEGAPTSARQHLLAAILACRTPAFSCRTTAAALHGLPGFTLAPFHIVTVTGRTTTVAGVTPHRSKRLDPTRQTTLDRIPVTTITRTLFDLCGCVPFARAERAIDHALARRLVTIDALGGLFAVLARRGRLGSAGMRAFLEARGCGPEGHHESELERRFGRLVADAGIPAPEVQVDLGADDGWIGRVDAYFREARLVVELDGTEHHSSLSDRRADAQRDAALREAGFEVIRMTWNEVVGHPANAIARLHAALSARSADHPNFVELASP